MKITAGVELGVAAVAVEGRALGEALAIGEGEEDRSGLCDAATLVEVHAVSRTRRHAAPNLMTV